MRQRLRLAATSRPAVRAVLAAGMLLGVPTTIAQQDLAAQFARAAGADLTWRRHVSSQLTTGLKKASFALPRPANAMMASDGPSNLVVAMLTLPEENPARVPDHIGRPTTLAGTPRQVVYPSVNRSAKGDMLVDRARFAAPARQTPSDPNDPLFNPTIMLRGSQSFMTKPWDEAITPEDFSAAPEARIEMAAVGRAGTIAETLSDVMGDGVLGLPRRQPAAPLDDGPVELHKFEERHSSVEPTGIVIEGLSAIASASVGLGTAAKPLDAETTAFAPSPDALAALDPVGSGFSADRRGDRPDPVVSGLLAKGTANLSLDAAKPRYSALPYRTSSNPALTLQLSGKELARAEKCLADAVYWESRSEPESGQIAVAQVVVNRAISGFYPKDICGVVYQNAHRYLSCQFTFACEGRKNLIATEPFHWEQAKRIARDMLAGSIWLPKVGNATHYHATYVKPWWARSMKKHDHIGLHVFYRPKAWSS